MPLPSRRDFLKTSAAALTLAANTRLLHATPFNLPLGIQLYSVREDLARNFEPTLQTLASLGYQALATTSSGFAMTLGRPDGSVSLTFQGSPLRPAGCSGISAPIEPAHSTPCIAPTTRTAGCYAAGSRRPSGTAD